MPRERRQQLAYSEQMEKMLDEEDRRTKARKLIGVLLHFLGRSDLDGLRVTDIGCSAGFIASELARAGGLTVGIDIDEPGLAKASRRFGDRVLFVRGDGEQLPAADRSLDVIVFNHIYEHVVHPDAVFTELHRVLADNGALYLGLANRLGILEPHYRLPFLSYLPPRLADLYVRLSGRGDGYYERLRTKPTLRSLARGFTVWDYTVSVIRESQLFAAEGMIPGPLRSMPTPALKTLMPVIPTYIWVATKNGAGPAGRPLRANPERVYVGTAR
jgi:ubiquinone/menaquinone biosynthesis C-methylase UbiE